MVGSTDNQVEFNITSASTSPLAINFVFDKNQWLVVQFYESDGATLQTLESGIDYVHGGSGPAGTGTITLQSEFLSSIESGKLVIFRNTPPLQETDLTYNDRLPSTLIERSLDRITRSVQDAILTGETFRFPKSDPQSYNASYTFESAVERAGTINVFSDSTTTPGKPERLTYEEIAPKILQHVDLGNVGEEVLAAISAVEPIRVYTTPTSSTGNKKASQFAYKAFAFSALNVTYGATLTVIPQDGEENGRPYYYYEDANRIRYIRWDSNQEQWEFYQETVPGGSVTITTATGDTDTPDLADWGGDPTVTDAGSDIPGTLWWNSQQDGLDPVWVEIITRNSFLNLPTSNPNIAGQFFRTSTTILNVSQG